MVFVVIDFPPVQGSFAMQPPFLELIVLIVRQLLPQLSPQHDHLNPKIMRRPVLRKKLGRGGRNPVTSALKKDLAKVR
jgi:hypothetical protein